MDIIVFSKEWWFYQPWRWANTEGTEAELRLKIPSTNWLIYNKKAMYFPFNVLYKTDKFNLKLEVETY